MFATALLPSKRQGKWTGSFAGSLHRGPVCCYSGLKFKFAVGFRSLHGTFVSFARMIDFLGRRIKAGRKGTGQLAAIAQE